MKKGFTLVELAIVVIVVGFIVGGVLSGQELIQQAKLRKEARELQYINLAVKTFYAKYNGLPGDLIRASNFFPQCLDNMSPGASGLEIESDNNLQIELDSGVGNESTCVWMQLYNSGLYIAEGLNAGGVDNSDPDALDPIQDINFQTDSYQYAEWPIKESLHMRIYYHDFLRYHSNVVFIGAPDNATVPSSYSTPEHMRNIDEKLDDGKPGTGVVVTMRTANECFTNRVIKYPPVDSEYDLTDTGESCALIYKLK